MWTLWRGNDLLPADLVTFPGGAFVAGTVWLVAFTHDADASAA